MASTLKCDTVTTLDGAGNITFSRPIVADGSNLTNLNISALAGNKLTGEVVAKGDGSSTDGKLTLNCSQNTHGVSIQSPAHSAGASYTLTLPTTNGNASEFLQTDGSGVLSWGTVSAGGFTLGTSTATTSGSSVTFSGIPSGTKVIHLNFVGVSTNGTQEMQLRIGDAGGIESSGYTSTSASIRGSNQANDMDSDGGAFKVGSTNEANDIVDGTMILTLENASSNTWCSMGVLKSKNSVEMEISAGSKSLSAELTQLYLWNPGGQVFDAGKVNISYQ